MILLDFLHSLFVLIGSGSYLLPLWEGVQRKSIFYTTLFSLLLLFSVVLHCEETGLTEPLNENLHTRLKSISQALTYYLFNVMILVVLEIRSEIFGRSVVAFWSVIVYFFPLTTSFSYTVIITFILSIIILIIDVAMHSRKFTTAYWRRLGLIAIMAIIGAGLFRILHILWVWHGIGHIYASIATYLLLLAQRTKQKLSSGKPHGSVGSNSGSNSSGTNRGNGGMYDNSTSSSTPLKQRKTTNTNFNDTNSTTTISNSNSNLKEDGAIASALPLSPNVQQRGNKGNLMNNSNFTEEGPIPV